MTRSRRGPLERRRLDRPRPQPLQLARRAGEHDDHAAAGIEHDAGGGAGDAERDGAVGQRRLLADARREVGIRATHALGEPPRDLLDLGLERVVDVQLTACDAGHELDRPVVVGRPEATRDEADVGLEPLAQCRLELVRVVADDRDARRLETEPERFLRVERAVEIGSLAPDELAARHDDCCAGALKSSA